MATLSIRIDLGGDRQVGPGKARLLELIAEHGSIAAAGRALDMSYKRAWDLVAALNACFGQPVVAAQPGGRHGGGATLTPFGRDLVAHYRAVEAKAHKAAALHLAALEAALPPEAPAGQGQAVSAEDQAG